MYTKKIGTIVSLNKSSFVIDIDNKLETYIIPNNIKHCIVVGDIVVLNNFNIIEKIIDRRNIVYRSLFSKSKFIAANIDQILIIIAVKPSFSVNLLQRILIEASRSSIESTIILNKIDLKESKHLNKILEMFSNLKINIVKICAHDTINTKLLLYKILKNKKNLFLGQSGMGKSTIIKTIYNDIDIKTREFSQKLNTGKHTTSFIKSYKISEINATVIDAPGFQTFGLNHVTEKEILKAFYEFEPFFQNCKYYNCKHIYEKECGIKEAIKNNIIYEYRYELYKNIMINK
ncbi:Small ribosomal subunit biogenesis GTPase RsgA [Candidatus Kinetoplastibacterium sorsogonicusi]|uniref:Small ribosomal subunit biogenesis GTPase RsgA n=1 Tax=Candidatus Kinetoplastidibacterium kentomonadis TaxID=1576550 RepID=A0A3Q8EUE1_9PROT|nr:ribosome small subunit-dependent GTPase A [Candidatus Kinetoplastibacterium sorsogonicusi]AWD32520.1 Small ribosomal subunit biogenesis GTPase RsgA [Candidatus Kinetoplastibacterium sorsogonicusi]